MPRDNTLRIIAAVLAAVGALIVWRSTPWGILAFDSVVRSLGSLSDESQITAVYAGSMAAWRTIGGVLLGVGLYRALGSSIRG